MGINAGILRNAEPLSSEQIKEIERRVLVDKQAYAYLNEAHEICFAVPYGVECIKELACHNAYELTTDNGYLLKRHYKKYGYDSFELSAILQKQTFDEPWSLEAPTKTLAPGLYESGAIALYNAGDTKSASAMLKTSWEELVANNVIAVSEGFKLPAGAAPNEYGFYYGIPYSLNIGAYTYAFTFNKDGSVLAEETRQTIELMPGAAVYRDHTIDVTEYNMPFFTVSADGLSITGINSMTGERRTYSLSNSVPPKGAVYLPSLATTMPTSIINGDLVIINDGSAGNLGSQAFIGQVQLTGIIIPDSVTSIGSYAFEGCSNLSSVVIGNGVTSLGEDAFYNCNGLTELHFNGTIAQWTAISKGGYLNYNSNNYTIRCTDGDVIIN